MATHLVLLVAEAALCGAILLGLFRYRQHLGQAPVYLVLGALQYVQFIFAASFRIELTPWLAVNPASAVLFPLATFLVLLTYVEQDAPATRSLAYGIVISNVTLYTVSALAGQHLEWPGVVNQLQVSSRLFVSSWRVIVASSVAIVADVVAVIVVFEVVSRRRSLPLFVRLWTAAATVMVLDSVLFNTIAFVERPAYWRLVTSGVVSKLAGATFYAALTAWYVRVFEQPPAPTGEPSDAFTWLTYRQRYEEAQVRLSRDPLTGLYNRGYFDECLARQLAHADRAGHQMSLVLLDVDGLKPVNDVQGHPAGDALLQFVSGEIARVVRAADAACRYGGDEFAVVLTSADAAAARVFGDRLVEGVRTRSLRLESAPAWAPVTVTLGIATYPGDGTTASELVRRADARMYAGKRAGGDRVVVHDGEPSTVAPSVDRNRP